MRITVGGRTYTYLDGLGWLDSSLGPGPIIRGKDVYVSKETLSLLGLDLPRITGLRISDNGTVRLVLDLEGLGADHAILAFKQEGRVQSGESLRFDLASLLPPLDFADELDGIEVELVAGSGGTELVVVGPAMQYEVFGLSAPERFVLDLKPLETVDIEEFSRDLRPGVRHHRFVAPTERGESGVHVLEFSPYAGQFRVVGAAGSSAKLSDLADGAFAAINAGYFDTRTFEPIGLLRVDYAMLSLPSRNRASVGFGFGRPVVDRIQAQVKVRISNILYDVKDLSERELVRLYQQAGQPAGKPSQGVIVVQGGRVIENKVGPRTVPENGFALAYEPELRALALVNRGEFAALEVEMEPKVFEALPYAVEAGPLLMQNGLEVYQPDLEQFRTGPGTRIVEGYVQQAAIGVRPDGTVLFVTADDMNAADLLPLFQSLGASEAMRLDSGSSTTLFADGRILNRHLQRQIVSAIVFLPQTPSASRLP